MDQTEMREMVEHVMVAVQRYRSMAFEELPEPLAKLASTSVQQWSVGGQALPMCEKMLAGERIVPMDFYNLMTICHLLAPEIALAVKTLRDVDLPEPTMEMMKWTIDQSPWEL